LSHWFIFPYIYNEGAIDDFLTGSLLKGGVLRNEYGIGILLLDIFMGFGVVMILVISLLVFWAKTLKNQ
jgi:hypothetical protein